MSWLYSVKEGVSALLKSKFSSLLSILSMAVSLFFCGIFLISILHGWKLVHQLKSQIVMEVFLKDGVTQELVETLQSSLRQQKEIEQVIFISKEKALAGFQKELGENVLTVLGENPLPASFQIRLRPQYHEQNQVKQLQNRIQTMSGVDEVVYRYDLLRIIQHYLKIAVIITLVLGGILVVTSILLISNTIRLSIQTKRDLIEIMSLVGATSAFIRRPFVVEGALQGALGAAIAIGGIFLLFRILNLLLPGLEVESAWVNGGLLFWGIFLGSIGSWIAIHRFLRIH